MRAWSWRSRAGAASATEPNNDAFEALSFVRADARRVVIRAECVIMGKSA